MLKAKSYNQARELLFKRLLSVSTLGLILVILLNLFSQNYSELLVTITCLALFALTWFSFQLGSKKVAYHLFLSFLILILCYPIFVLGNSYSAIIIYPVAALIYNFVFFEDKRILWFYLLIFGILEFFLLVSSMEVDINNLPNQFFAEYINCMAYMICIFFIGQFFIANLKKQQNAISLAKEDIDQKKTELSLKNETLDKYIESNIQLESFAHLAAHELKAPLRSVSGFAGLLRRKIQDRLTPDEDKMFGIISTSNRQMHDMIGALNQLGSVSKMELNPTEFKIEDLISEILFDRKESIDESSAIINTNINIPLVTADRLLLKQLLSNLIGNALKFMEKGKTPEVHINVDKADEGFKFVVIDNGIGIREEDREKIFTLFERLNNTKSYNGSGIGLAISKKIIDLHGGEIWVESAEPHGTVFNFIIPV